MDGATTDTILVCVDWWLYQSYSPGLTVGGGLLGGGYDRPDAGTSRQHRPTPNGWRFAVPPPTTTCYQCTGMPPPPPLPARFALTPCHYLRAWTPAFTYVEP